MGEFDNTYRIGADAADVFEIFAAIRREAVETGEAIKKAFSGTAGDARKALGVSKEDIALLRQAKAAAEERAAATRADTAEINRQAAEARRLRAEMQTNTVATKANTAAAREGAAIARQAAAEQQRNAAVIRTTTAEHLRDVAALRRHTEQTRTATSEVQRSAAVARTAAAQSNAQAAATRAATAQINQQAAAHRAAGAAARSHGSSILELGSRLRTLVSAFLAFQAVQYVLRGAFAFITEGVGINAKIETMKLGIATLVASFYEIRTASGQSLTGVDKLNAAISLSDDLMREVQISALETVLTTQQLAEAFQQGIGAAAGAKVPLDQVLGVVKGITLAATALGVPAHQMNEEVRSVLSGVIHADSRVAHTLGLTKALVEDWKRQGTLVEELNKRLEIVNLSGARVAATLAGSLSNLQEAVELFAKSSTAQLSEAIKRVVQDALPRLFDFKNFDFQPQVRALADLIDSTLGKVADRAREVIDDTLTGLDQIGAFLKTYPGEVDRLTDGAVSFLSQSIGLVTDIIAGAAELLGTILEALGAIVGMNTEAAKQPAIWDETSRRVSAVADGLNRLGLFIAFIRDVLGFIVEVIQVSVLGLLKGVLVIVGKISDVVINLGKNLSSFGGGLYEGFKRLLSGDVLGAGEAFNAIKLTSVIDPTGFGSAIAGAVDDQLHAAGEELTSRFTGDFFRNLYAEANRQAIAAQQTAKAAAGLPGGRYTTTPGPVAPDANDKAAKAAERAAERMADAIARVRGQVDELAAALPLVAGQFAEIHEKLAAVKPGDSEGLRRAAEAVQAILAGSRLFKADPILSQLERVRAAADNDLKKFAEGVNDIKPSAKQLADYRGALDQKVHLQQVNLIRKAAEFETEAREKIAGMQQELAAGATAVAGEYQKMQADIVAFTDKVSDNTLLNPQGRKRLVQDYRDASEALFNQEQQTRARDFYGEIRRLNIDLIDDASERQLAAIDVEQEAWEAQIRDRIKNEAVANDLINQHRTALMNGYFRDERRLRNERANEELEIQNRLILNDRERIRAQQQLNALRAAQAISPDFQPGAGGRTGGRFRAAQAEYDRQLDLERQAELANTIAQLRDQTRNPLLGNVGSILDFRAIKQAAAEMQQFGITLQDVGNEFGFVSTNARTLQLQIHAVAQIRGGQIGAGIVTGLKAITREALFSAQAFVQLGSTIGQAILGLLQHTTTAGEAVKAFFFGLIGDLLIQFGSFLIAVGAGLTATKILFGWSGGAAIAAGIFAIALGTVLKGLASSSSNAAGGATPGSVQAGDSGAPVAPPAQARIPRRAFLTAGESPFERPLPFVGDVGTSALRVEVEVLIKGDGVLTDAIATESKRATLAGARRGSYRNGMKRALGL
jgi:hypothetical protein